MEASNDEFFAELTLVRTPSSGGRFKKYNIKLLSFQDMLKKKKSIITIKNRDELCCARAIVTPQALCDNDSQYPNLKRNMPIQTRLAKLLHEHANVPEGPCGQAELEAFQAYLGPQYQLIVLEGLKGQIVYKNEVFNSAEHVIALLKIKSHYHAITSIPAFLNRGYFCRYCDRGYNDESAEQHNCHGQNCPSCRRSHKRCKNFAAWIDPSFMCQDCHRSFYGPDCFEAHKEGKKPVCGRFAKCVECCKVYRRKKQHTCYKTVCDNCGQYKYVNHKCYIQPWVEKEDEKDKEGEIEEEEEEETLQLPSVKKPPPLIVAFDIECEAEPIPESEEKVFKPVLIGWSILYEPNDYHEVRTIAEFLMEMRTLTVVDGEERHVYCYAHNLRAFDGLFIEKELYDQGYSIHGILNQGAKYLLFQCENLIFRDSMNFFSMPLEKLSATFNLKELHKGFFPYEMISKANENFIGPFPAVDKYKPDRMSAKRRKAFYKRYAKQQGKVFNYKKELSLYLESDVMVLREALQAFAGEMYSLTGVRPLTQCVTIASTAFQVWQKNFLEPNLIALEPQAGWRFNQVNQSSEALEWLEYQNTKYGGGIQVCIHHV